jgi:adenine/guanine/hypoxanthine permease
MLERWFHCRARGSRWTTEVTAGVSTFLALSYIFVVNPAILGETGIPRSAVLFATVATSALATLAMGLRTNLPFVLAPGMEINIYVAGCAAAAGLSWRAVLGAVFWSGILFLLFTISGVRRQIIESLPRGMGGDLAASVGVLLIAFALQLAGLLRYDKRGHLAGLGAIGMPTVVLLATAGIVFVLALLRVRAAVLISIVAGSALAGAIGMHADRMATGGGMFTAVGAADLRVILRPNAWTIILALFLIDFYGSVAKLVGLLRNTELLENWKLPRMGEALLIDGAAATTGSLLGTTSVLIYAESGVGIAAGGRTGLTAVTAALLMLACLGAAPLLSWVPIVAATFRLDQALLLGLVLHLLRDFSKGVRLNAYAVGSLGLLMAGWALSW